MRSYDVVQREIDALEGSLDGRGVDVWGLGRAVDCELAARLGVEAPARMPALLEALYDERDAIGAGQLSAVVSDLRGALLAGGFSGPEAEAVLRSYSLDGRRVDAVGQYLACGGARLAGGDWRVQADGVQGSAGLSRPRAFAAVSVVSEYFRRAVS